MEKVLTTCVYCGTGCQVYLKVQNGKVVDTKPVRDGFNPGKGKLCIKGWSLHEFIHSPERLTDPLIKKNGKFEKVSWDEAIQYCADNFKKIMKENPDDKRVLACLSSAKCTNEENYAMQKFARAVFKTNSVDHCARLCHASTVAGLAASFGSGAMTNSLDEISDADVIYVTGSNTNEQHPLIGKRILESVHKGGTLIVADPRTIPLSEIANDHEGIVMNQWPGTDVALLNGMMNYIISNDLHDKDFIEKYCENFEAFKEEVMKMSPAMAADICGVKEDDIIKAAKTIANAKACSLIYSMGITQHTTGTDNVKSTANLQMLCGNMGKWGTGVNPLRGQQNVQGACDLGALSNVFSGYQKVIDPEARKKMADIWNINVDDMDTEVGRTVVEIMNDAYDGKLKGLWVMGENPMVSDPDINHVREGLKKVFLVVSDIFMTPTAELADVVLPAASFAETDGTFTSTERRIQLIRKAVDPVGNSISDWEIISLMAQAMGYDGLNYSHPKEIDDEINKTTPIYAGITWERLNSKRDGLQWPCRDISSPGTIFLHKDGAFVRGKGHLNVCSYIPPKEGDPKVDDPEYPLVLSTGRVLWHFHTGTMSRRSPTLHARVPEGYIEISIEDANEMGIVDGEKVKVSSRRGEVITKAKVTHRVRKGLIFMPFHFKEAAANVLTNPVLDPTAKIPEFKVCSAKVEKL
ncbi:MAG: formate dehydrogenase subunit alpha [Candidatus Lokiarchaeota archaeon]|nr:formate dehydrogenase subunit alpha [Candidatus Lokiarchaeota archaeon]